MRFIADSMLGKLARWLRLMGYDVLYSRDFTDDEIIKLAEDRLILTRDREFASRAGGEGLAAQLVSDTEIMGQLQELKEEAGIELRDSPGFARCPLCNGSIVKIKKELIEETVPDNVSEFWVCETCKKVYWEGGHWKNIKETIKEVEGRGKDVQNPKR